MLRPLVGGTEVSGKSAHFGSNRLEMGAQILNSDRTECKPPCYHLNFGQFA